MHTVSMAAMNSGDAVSLDAITKAEVIQGELPKAWEPGKVYVLECWATWCHPCIQAIPHADAMYDKYKDQGLVVIGVDVWENNKDAVANFVKKKGEGMSYPVIFTGGKGSAFDSDWLKQSGVTAIPHAFVVKDGKLLFGIHPGRLTEEAIVGLLAGGEKQEAVVKSYLEIDKIPPSFAFVGEFQDADAAKDVEKMAQALAGLEKVEPQNRAIPGFRVLLQIRSKNWVKLEKALQAFPIDVKETGAYIDYCAKIDMENGVPESVYKACIAKLEQSPCSTTSRFSDEAMKQTVISRFQWRLGDKAAAAVSADLAVKNAKPGFEMIFQNYAKSLKEDQPQSCMRISSACFSVILGR